MAKPLPNLRGGKQSLLATPYTAYYLSWSRHKCMCCCGERRRQRPLSTWHSHFHRQCLGRFVVGVGTTPSRRHSCRTKFGSDISRGGVETTAIHGGSMSRSVQKVPFLGWFRVYYASRAPRKRMSLVPDHTDALRVCSMRPPSSAPSRSRPAVDLLPDAICCSMALCMCIFPGYLNTVSAGPNQHHHSTASMTRAHTYLVLCVQCHNWHGTV